MSNGEIYNSFTGDGDYPVNLPPTGHAWEDMRKRLDDEMPVNGILLPGNIITAGTSLINGITALFTLLLMGSVARWVSDKAPGSTIVKKQSAAKVLGNNYSINSATKSNAVSNNNVNPAATQNSTLVVTGNHYNGKQRKLLKGQAIVVINGNVKQKTGDTTSTKEGKAVSTSATNPLKVNTAATKVNTAAAAALNKKDSLVNDGPKVETEEKKITLQAGLLWTVQLPFAGTQQYFAGPNASQQAYRVVLPAVWISVQSDNSLFMAEVNSFATTVYKPRPFVTTSQVNGQAIFTQTKQLNKVFGFTAAFRYDNNIAGNWWAGGGLQASWLSKGVATINAELDNGGTSTNYTTVKNISDSDWAYLSKFRVRLDAELLYKKARWNTGIRAGVYFTPMGRNYGGPKNPLEVELFYAWAIWNKTKK